MGLNFRAEFFNLWNHAQYGLPVNDLAVASLNTDGKSDHKTATAWAANLNRQHQPAAINSTPLTHLLSQLTDAPEYLEPAPRTCALLRQCLSSSGAFRRAALS